MIVASVSDIHWPKNSDMFRRAVEGVDWSSVDALILAGDVVYRGAVEACAEVLDLVRRRYGGIILGVLGNEEYDDRVDRLVELCSDVLWLIDESYTMGGICVVGSRGSLDRPTSWQLRNIPNIVETYAERIKNIEKLLKEAGRRCSSTVLVTHYAPRCETLTGENPRIWSQLSSSRLRRLIERYRPDVAIHGHAHRGRIPVTKLGSTRVYNVALPATGRITTIEVSPAQRKTILDYF